MIAEQIPHLRRFARALTGDVHEADDLVQDCLERALRKRALWFGRGSIRAWMFKILHREFLNKKRRARPTGAEPPAEEGAGGSEAPRQIDLVHCAEVLAALDRLPDEQRAAVTLVALEELAYDDAARILEIPVGTLRSRLSRGRAALKDSLADRRRVAEPVRPERCLRRAKC